MNKKITKNKKLILSTATIRHLANAELAEVLGGDGNTESKTDPKNPCRPI